MSNAKPRTDREGITRTMTALRNSGWKPWSVTYPGAPAGEEWRVKSYRAAVPLVLDLEDSALVVYYVEDNAGWVRFVLGNDPTEVVCDYTVNLEPVLGPLTDSWY